MTQREAIFPANRHALYEFHRYSAAIRSGTSCSSRARSKPLRWLARARLRASGATGLRQPRAVLKAAGCTLEDVVDVTTFHTDPAAQIEIVMAVRERVIGEPPYPNWTAVGVNWLAGFDFEIKAIARIPQGA